MRITVGAVACAVALAIAPIALAQQNVGLGKYEFHSKCASCHGTSGKGDGPMSKFLNKAPADLTTLAKRNGGAFPRQLIWQTIDGRPAEEGPHGSREMPIWGQEYRMEILRATKSRSAGPEQYVAGRIEALLEYLASIQVK